jgi:hypothetical protein
VDDLQRLLLLYVRPRAAMSAIVDEGGLLIGAVGVLLVSLLMAMPMEMAFVKAVVAASQAAERQAAARPPHAQSSDEDEDVPAPPRTVMERAFQMSSLFGGVGAIAGVALLYVPAVIFLMTLMERRAGSFGVALPRDYGALAPCAFFAWTAAHLPFALLALGLAMGGANLLVISGLELAGMVVFVGYMTIALRTVYAARATVSVIAASLACALIPLRGYLTFLASPFALYWAYIYLRGDISAIQWSMGSRRSFKRHLEAATINPRDAEAHYQLGLIHQRRGQYPEAIERFQKAIEIDAGEIDAHYQLGRIAREQGRAAQAIRHFESVVARDPKYARHEIWREVGATYVEAGDFANARPMLERYVEQRPYDPEGLYLLGVSLKTLGEAEKARDILQRCIDASKTAPDYRKGELRRWRNKAQAEL